MQNDRGLKSRAIGLLEDLRSGVHHPMFRLSVRECVPMVPGIAVWGLVTGAAMSTSTLDWPMAVLMTILVAAGAPQLAVLPLIAADAPVWSILATVVCTNLRYFVFSLHYRPYFRHLSLWRRVTLGYFIGDVTFALFNSRFPSPDARAGQVEYFMGGSVFCCVVWQAGVICGILGGQAIPSAWGMGFAGTMSLLALTCGQLRDAPTRIAALAAAGVAVAAYALPMRLNIMVAVVAASTIGLFLSARRLKL